MSADVRFTAPSATSAGSLRSLTRIVYRQVRTRARLPAGVVTIAAVVVALFAPSASADEGTHGYDNMRSSWDRDESKVSPALVGASDFGLQFSATLPAVPGTTLNKI